MQCPKCQRELSSSGTVEAGGEELTVYQCDECLVPWKIGGESIDVALTFAVTANGRYVDAADPTRPIDLN